MHTGCRLDLAGPARAAGRCHHVHHARHACDAAALAPAVGAEARMRLPDDQTAGADGPGDGHDHAVVDVLPEHPRDEPGRRDGINAAARRRAAGRPGVLLVRASEPAGIEANRRGVPHASETDRRLHTESSASAWQKEATQTRRADLAVRPPARPGRSDRRVDQAVEEAAVDGPAGV